MGEPVVKPVFKQQTSDALLPVADTPINTDSVDKPLAWLVGCHGGAGVTTLATVLAPFADAHGVIPAANDPRCVLLVAEQTKRGLRAAHQAVLQFETGNAGNAELVGVLIVRRLPGKPPKALDGDMDRLIEATPGHFVWEVPFFGEWAVSPYSALPEWRPGQSAPTQKKRLARKRSVLDGIPEHLAGVADEVFDRAGTVYRRSIS